MRLQCGSLNGQRKKNTKIKLQELLGQAGHYSERTRRSALLGLSSLLERYPGVLFASLSTILPAIALRVADGDAATRAAARDLWTQRVSGSVSEAQLAPFLPLLMAHVCSAATHIQTDVRLDSFRFLSALVADCPRAVAAGHGGSVLQLFAASLSQVRTAQVAVRTQS